MDYQRPVKRQLTAQGLQCGLVGLHAQQSDHRITGDHADQREGDDRDADEDRQQADDSDQDNAKHAAATKLNRFIWRIFGDWRGVVNDFDFLTLIFSCMKLTGIGLLLVPGVPSHLNFSIGFT